MNSVPRWVNFHWLETFYVVAKNQSVTKGCQELKRTQSTVSQTIKKLEVALQLKLFIRHNRGGMELTESGKALLKYGEILSKVSEAILRDTAGEVVE